MSRKREARPLAGTHKPVLDLSHGSILNSAGAIVLESLSKISMNAAPGSISPLARFEFVRDIGVGNFGEPIFFPCMDHPPPLRKTLSPRGRTVPCKTGVAKLMMDRVSGELIAVKFIERGDKVCCRRRRGDLDRPNISYAGGQECRARDPESSHAQPSQHRWV